ncbi:MAG: SDR family NAD(P)-dependent oxidoreductase [Pseudomonadota bacterium]
MTQKTILISGATSGIGAEMARQYAMAGHNLLLIGRNEQRLKQVLAECSENKSIIIGYQAIDVRDKETLEEWLLSMDEKYNIDVIIANAGISAGTAEGNESYQQIKDIIDTNLYGVINMIDPLIANMQKRQKGQIAIISSLAGYRGLPSCPAYSASKGAVKIYGEALRGLLAKDGIGVTVITPGYIKSAMTDRNDFYMPFLLQTDKAVNIMIRKLSKNPARIAFPKILYFFVWFMSILPPFITDPIFARLPKKG